MMHEQENITIKMTRRQISWLLATLLSVVVAVFIVGYTWGRWSAMQAVADKATQDSFIDQANYALLAMYEKPAVRNVDMTGHDGMTMMPSVEAEESQSEEQEVVASLPVYYQGLIIGFGHYASAQQFVSKLAGQGITALIQEKISWNGKKKRVWYQVVTERYTDREALEKLVEKIARSSKIKHAKIERCLEQ